MVEQWRPISGYIGKYEVSDQGRVRSLERVCSTGNGGTRPVPGRIRALTPNSRGYLGVILCDGEAGKKRFEVHTLVAKAFIGPRPKGMEVCHNDGNPSNNTRKNLRYDTHSKNSMDRVNHGTTNRGERHGMNKLTEEEVHSIRALLDRGMSQTSISRRFGITQSAVSNINTSKTWGWLCPPPLIGA